MSAGDQGRTVVLDAGVMIALMEVQDAHHPWSAHLLRSMPTVRLTANALTLAEALVSASRRGEADAAHTALKSLDLSVTELTASDAIPLAELRARTSLRMPDATVLHEALTAGAQLATTDARLARIARTHGVTVHCP